MTDNSLQQVQDGAFTGLVTLEELYLENNDLTYFPALTNLPALRILHLQDNQIQNIGYEAFVLAPALQDV